MKVFSSNFDHDPKVMPSITFSWKRKYYGMARSFIFVCLYIDLYSKWVNTFEKTFNAFFLRPLYWLTNNSCDSVKNSLTDTWQLNMHILVFNRGYLSFRISYRRKLYILTIPRLFPPLANPSPILAGFLFSSSCRFFWYSSSNVRNANFLPIEPPIRDTAPAVPPKYSNKTKKMFEVCFQNF